MNTSLKKASHLEPSILSDVLAYLTELWQERMNITEARQCLKRLQNRHPHLRFELIWDEESYSYTVQYSILLYLPEGGTATISISPDHPLPWLLRWASHPHAKDIVRVNGNTITVDELMACAESLWEQTPILSKLINFVLTREAIQEKNIQPNAVDFQTAMDRFRRSRGLLTAQSMHEWLEQRGFIHARLELLLEFEAATVALRNLIADEAKIQDYWRQHPRAFDVADIASFQLQNQEQAKQVYTAIYEGAVSFYEAAESKFLVGKRSGQKETLLSRVQRSSLSPDYAEAIFAASPGEVIGPLSKDNGFEIVKILKQHTADLTETATHESVKVAVFNEWLKEREKKSKIEWFWGRVEDDGKAN